VLGDSAEKHSSALSAVKDAHAKHVKELEAVKAAHAHHALLAERLAYLEEALGESADKHARELASAHAKFDTVHSRVAACEAHGAAISDLKRTHTSFASEKASLQERVVYIEGMLGDSAEKHAMALDNFKDAHAKHAKELEAVKAAHSQHATMAQRLDALEKALSDASGRHTQDLTEAHTKLDRLHSRLSTCETTGSDLKKAHAGLTNEKAGMAAHQATLQERVDYLETMQSSSADKHARELDSVKAAHAKLAGEAKAHQSRFGELAAQEREARETHHATVEERLQCLETALGESADKHARELKAHHGSVRDLLAKEKDARDLGHSSLNERVDYLENLLGDNAVKHTKELDPLKASHSRLTIEMKARDAQHFSLADRVDDLEKAFVDSNAKVDAMYGRVSAVREAWRRTAAAEEVPSLGASA